MGGKGRCKRKRKEMIMVDLKKLGEFYGEEKLIWAASWGDGVEGERCKGKRKDDAEVSCEKRM